MLRSAPLASAASRVAISLVVLSTSAETALAQALAQASSPLLGVATTVGTAAVGVDAGACLAAAAQPVVLARPNPVQRDRAGLDPALRLGARAEVLREELVDPFAGGLRRYAQWPHRDQRR